MKKLENEEEIKIILLGESGVGKTSIIKRFLYDKFNPNIEPSVTMNYGEKVLELDKQKFRLFLWDTIGQEKYRSLSKLFLNETQIVILVYSITDMKSFKELNYWNNLYKEKIGKEVVLGVAGNKNDLYLSQEITEEFGKQYAEENNAIFSLLSAKDNKVGIDEYITKLVKEYLEIKKNKIQVDDFEIIEKREKGIILNSKKIEKLGYNKEGCCSGKAKARRKKYEEIIKNNKGYLDSIFLGENGVGKTSLIKIIDGNRFDENEKPTNFLTKYETEYTNATMQFNINIYDINNEEVKIKKTEEIIKKSIIYFLVYDLNDLKTLNKLNFWLKVIENCKKEEKNQNKIIVIIGNKKDLINNKNDKFFFDDLDSPIDNGKNLAKENDALYFQVSAKDDKDIKEIMGIAIEKYLNI